MIAVEPSYQRRGVGTKLVRHGMQIATREMVKVGSLAAESGLPLYTALGFATVDKVEIKDDRPDFEAKMNFYV